MSRTASSVLLSFLLLTVLLLSTSCSAPASEASSPAASEPQASGQIYLYGEAHSDERVQAKELELWGQYYTENGIRHLFVEYPYHDAELLNLWMAADDDAIFDAMFENWKGTAGYSESTRSFLHTIKENYPETVFHGTDVGHDYATNGEAYLTLLRENGQENSAQYRRAQEVIKQGKRFYDSAAETPDVYRENTMTENFLWAYEQLDGADVMGIYGSSHTDPAGMNASTGQADAGLVPCMANQLKQRYGERLLTEDLTETVHAAMEPLRTDTLTINGKEYQASYFGEQALSAQQTGCTSRAFWRLENAFADFARAKTTGDVLPYDNYPMKVEQGQVFLVRYTKTDGSTMDFYYRSSCAMYQGKEATVGVAVEKED